MLSKWQNAKISFMEIVREHLKYIEAELSLLPEGTEKRAMVEARIELLQAMFAACWMSDESEGT